MNISSAGGTSGWASVQGQRQPPPPPAWLSKLDGDTSDEAKAVKAAKEKLDADMKSGDVDASTLKADRAAFHEAVKAYKEKNGIEDQGPMGPPPPREASGGLGQLLEALKTDDSEEATGLKDLLAQLRTNAESGTAPTSDDKEKLKAALEAFLDKLDTASVQPGALVNCQA